MKFLRKIKNKNYNKDKIFYYRKNLNLIKN